MQAALNLPKLSLTDLARVASVGLRTRRVRAALSALGMRSGSQRSSQCSGFPPPPKPG